MIVTGSSLLFLLSDASYFFSRTCPIHSLPSFIDPSITRNNHHNRQFFHPESRELEDRGVGTHFYEIKPEYRDRIEIHERDNPRWLDYRYFTSVKHMPVVPNHFFAFAPCNHSWHGAAIDPSKMEGVNQFARRTFLGFVTTDNWNFHHFHANDWAPEEFDIVVKKKTE
jgi:hypothetical protein